MGDRDRQEGG
ncbi:hypothetical protein HaLaN_19157, partial [Haematococcus lacustris]